MHNVLTSNGGEDLSVQPWNNLIVFLFRLTEAARKRMPWIVEEQVNRKIRGHDVESQNRFCVK